MDIVLVMNTSDCFVEFSDSVDLEVAVVPVSVAFWLLGSWLPGSGLGLG